MMFQELTINGIKIIPDSFIPTTFPVKRTWRERLFTWPLKPFKKYKQVKEDRAYFINGQVLVSHKTFAKLLAEDREITDSVKYFIEHISSHTP